MALTREDILSGSDALKEVDVPEFGGSVFVRQLGADKCAKFAEQSA